MEKIACYKHYVWVCLLEETSIWNTLKESVHPIHKKHTFWRISETSAWKNQNYLHDEKVWKHFFM